MADVSFYKYLEAAFRYRLFNPAGQRASLQTKFNALGYNLPYERIFYYARRLLPKFYTSEFPDTEEGNLQMAKKVLEKLDKHQDTQLENQFKAVTVSEKNAQIIAEAQAQSQQAAAQQVPPAGTSTGTSFGLPGLPSAPSISSGPRRVFIANQTPPPVGGMEGGIGQGTAATNKANMLEAQRVGPATAKASRLEAETNRLNVQTTAPRRFNWGGFKIPTSFTNAAKNFGSNAQIFARKNLGRIAGGLGDIAKGVGRGVAGPSLTGAYNLLGKAGNGSLNAFERITRPGGIGGGGIGKGLSKSSNKLAWGLIGIMLFLVLFGSMLGGLAGTTPIGEAAPIAPISTDISSCKFTRDDTNPPAESYKSPTLLSYFQQAANTSSVPTSVLAAIARVESPSITNKTDADLPNLSLIAGCPRSPTGALGIMQIQPPGTRGYIQAAVEKGANYLGKTADQLTENDFCDLKSNITIASGFILKKLQLAYGLGDGTKWDTSWTNNKDVIYKLAEGYYGCLQYGGPDPLKCGGPHNYGDDIWTSIQGCQVAILPPPPADGNYKKWVQDFGINMNDGFASDVYKWAYEVLVTTFTVTPKFQTLLNLSTAPIEVKPICGISKTEGRTIFLRNRMVFCVTVGIVPQGPTIEPDLFKQVLIHELGHIIYNTDRGNYNTRIIQARTQDNGLFLTAYSQNAASAADLACGPGDDNGNRADEDFAESISYFINNGITAKDYGQGCGILVDELNLNPFDVKVNGQRKYSAHYQFMTDLLK